MKKDYYDILGVGKDASPEEIKSAWKKKVKELHPDVNPDGETLLIEINEAYDILKDPQKKAIYDTGESQYHSEPGYGRYDPFRSPFMYRNRARSETIQNNIRVDIGVSIKTLVNGGTTSAVIPVPIMSQNNSFGFQMSQATVEFNIEPKTPIGSVIILTPAEHKIDTINGNIIVRILPEPPNSDNIFIRGVDVFIGLDLDVFDAMLGCKKEIDIPTGGAVSVTIPPKTDNDATLRLAKRGLYGPNGVVGDVYLVIGLTMPDIEDDKLAKIKEIIRPSNT